MLRSDRTVLEGRAATAAETAGVAAEDVALRLAESVSSALQGKPEVVRLALTALVARGHLLVEDVPGVGKTTLASALARAVGGRFARLQCTSDLLPSDILGVSVFDPVLRRFEFREGPLFANVVLADEINRATPKTQSALLEAMAERRVSVDGVTRPLPEPFFVVATQNPVEHHGTFALPDSQMDRFAMRLSIGYPSATMERAILAGEERDVAAPAVLDPAGLARLQEAAARVRAVSQILEYVVAIVQATRRLPGVAIGVSPRGSLALLRAARAAALIDGRDYVRPGDVKDVAVAVLAHRLVFEGAADGVPRDAAEDAVREVLAVVAVPR